MADTNFRLDDALDMVSRTPHVIRTLLQGLPDDWVNCNEGEHTWSPAQVVGHLIHGEKADWVQRAQIIMEHGETKPFEPFDRSAHLNEKKPLPELLDEFQQLRAENITTIRALISSEADLDRKGVHPALGSVTLRELLATWVAHDLNHIGQIVRVMAKHYGADVGPWKAYLGILKTV